MSQVVLHESNALAPQVGRLLARLLPQLRRLLPAAGIEHIGATAIPGALTKGDVDVCVRIAPEEFRAASDALAAHLAIKQPENWTEDFTSFGDDAGFELPVGGPAHPPRLRGRSICLPSRSLHCEPRGARRLQSAETPPRRGRTGGLLARQKRPV
ncbi:MAG: GrpB family protein [Opitutaceae bacterium]|nr:GrpB family protein [Opitutaceae bacterium]